MGRCIRAGERLLEFIKYSVKNIEILKVVVGSQAHGLANKNSDYDYRGVFAVPTSELLKIGGDAVKHTSWIEGKEDDTSWEIGKFLFMATKCNPTVLETFLAPFAPHFTETMDQAQLAVELRSLFPYIWNSVEVREAFIGYGVNQRKKFFDNKDRRAPKYACAYLRVLYNAWQLLSTGTFDVNLTGSPVFEICWKFKSGDCEPGEVIHHCMEWEKKVNTAYAENPDKKTNLEPVNEFLLKVRKQFWV